MAQPQLSSSNSRVAQSLFLAVVHAEPVPLLHGTAQQQLFEEAQSTSSGKVQPFDVAHLQLGISSVQLEENRQMSSPSLEAVAHIESGSSSTFSHEGSTQSGSNLRLASSLRRVRKATEKSTRLLETRLILLRRWCGTAVVESSIISYKTGEKGDWERIS
ncbi:LOW QUALITY PROTEIN: hypothetical protein M9H77_27115 [Catharanthus roseus]|uniref:Uncharacterized protein n=1 Tax=Catharanthus roseus TaxID=4058 RepID=A0ACC0AEA1_CATRO|nr:LOW QUALITY PROTEIN: hypothetical protein M9H77_27115 [Catharanthus roseus]